MKIVVSEISYKRVLHLPIKQNVGRDELSLAKFHVTFMECNYLIISGEK
ncbi:MAG: hypothetical protein GTO13_02600 [Proteobacteria bacterium]|nr:hypothetical protein [Pseudomonadota bacterium]